MRNQWRWSAVLIVGLVVWTAGLAWATGGGSLPPIPDVVVPVDPPGFLACTTNGGNNWKVEALTGPGGVFPVEEPCASPGLNAGKTCGRYSYRITRLKFPPLSGQNIEHVVFAVSADQVLDVPPTANPMPYQVVVSDPGDGDNVTNFLDRAFHEYAVRWKFSPTVPTSVDVHMVIVGPTSARVSTALVRRSPTESCLIAGPGVALDPTTPLASKKEELCANSKCLCTLMYSGGKLVSVTGSPIGGGEEGACTTTLTDISITVEGIPLSQAIKSFDQIPHGDDSCTTYPTKPKATTVCR
jgi:hypothetical protein